VKVPRKAFRFFIPYTEIYRLGMKPPPRPAPKNLQTRLRRVRKGLKSIDRAKQGNLQSGIKGALNGRTGGLKAIDA